MTEILTSFLLVSVQPRGSTLLSKTKDRERTWLNNVNLKQVEINAVITWLETDWYVCSSRDEAQGPCRRFSYLDKNEYRRNGSNFVCDRSTVRGQHGGSILSVRQLGMLAD